MRLLLFIFFVLSIQISFGQSHVAFTDSLKCFRDNFCNTDEEKNAINLIINNRDIQYLTNRLDTSKATKIKITEGYNFVKSKYRINEDYFVDTLSRQVFFEKELIFSNDKRSWWEEKYFDTVKNSIKYFNPYPITYIVGCGQAKHPRNESKIIARLKSKAEKSEPTKESFYLLTTVIDKQNNKISYELFIPKIAKREFCTDIWCISTTNSLNW
jgi:hypothetical protein